MMMTMMIVNNNNNNTTTTTNNNINNNIQYEEAITHVLQRYHRTNSHNIALYSPNGQLLPSSSSTTTTTTTTTTSSSSSGQPLQKDIPEENRIIVTLVGAGRGPLILCTLRAAAQTKRDVVIYAIEKNPNAIITLQTLHRTLRWGERVHVVETDMREYLPLYYSDIILSELLGSFSDNELSPECLIGAQRFLLDGGLFIPRDSTSYLACCMSSRIYNNVWND